MTEASARVALVLRGDARNALADVLSLAGYEVCPASGAEEVTRLLSREQVDAWIFDARAEDVLALLMGSAGLVLPADNLPNPADRQAFASWSGGLLRQLDAALHERAIASPQEETPGRWQQVRSVWVLAGSAGATTAVQQFLNAFDQPPPVAFIYAQHFDPEKQYRLEHYSLENNAFSLSVGEGTYALAPGKVIMIPPRCRVRIESFGRVSSIRAGWGQRHTPDINELLFILTAAKFPSSGVIFFSGMGDDGTAALKVFDAAGGRIWAQTPAAAVCPGMPQAAIDTGYVSRVGSASQLAAALLQLCQQTP